MIDFEDLYWKCFLFVVIQILRAKVEGISRTVQVEVLEIVIYLILILFFLVELR